MQIACISVPQRGTIAPNGRATAPGPRGGCAPRPCRFALGGSPATCHQGEVFVKTMGELQPVGRSGSRLLAGGQLLAVVHGATPKGKRRGAKAPPGIQLQGRRPSSWGWRSRPKTHRAHDFPWESVVSPLIAESGRMAGWHISQFWCESSSPRWRSIAP